MIFQYLPPDLDPQRYRRELNNLFVFMVGEDIDYMSPSFSVSGKQIRCIRTEGFLQYTVQHPGHVYQEIVFEKEEARLRLEDLRTGTDHVTAYPDGTYRFESYEFAVRTAAIQQHVCLLRPCEHGFKVTSPEPLTFPTSVIRRNPLMWGIEGGWLGQLQRTYDAAGIPYVISNSKISVLDDYET